MPVVRTTAPRLWGRCFLYPQDAGECGLLSPARSSPESRGPGRPSPSELSSPVSRGPPALGSRSVQAFHPSGVSGSRNPVCPLRVRAPTSAALRMIRAIAGDARTRGALGRGRLPQGSASGLGRPAGCKWKSYQTREDSPCPPHPALVNLESRKRREGTPILASHRQIHRLIESLCGDLGEPA